MGEKTETKIKLEEVKKVLKLRERLELEIQNKIATFEAETGMSVDRINFNRIQTFGENRLYTDLNITVR